MAILFDAWLTSGVRLARRRDRQDPLVFKLVPGELEPDLYAAVAAMQLAERSRFLLPSRLVRDARTPDQPGEVDAIYDIELIAVIDPLGPDSVLDKHPLSAVGTLFDGSGVIVGPDSVVIDELAGVLMTAIARGPISVRELLEIDDVAGAGTERVVDEIDSLIELDFAVVRGASPARPRRNSESTAPARSDDHGVF